MSKIGQLIIDLEEQGAIEYDSQTRTTLKLEDVPLKRGLPFIEGVIAGEHRKDLYSDGSWAVILFGDH
jgi:hypothetical protein